MRTTIHLTTPVPRIELIAETEFERSALNELRLVGPVEIEVFTKIDLTCLNILCRRIPESTLKRLAGVKED